MEVKDKVVTVEGLKGAYDNLNGKISANDTDITNLQNSVTQLNSDLLFNNRKKCKYDFSCNANTYTTFDISVSNAVYGIITSFNITSAPKASIIICMFKDLRTISVRIFNADTNAIDGNIEIYYV